MKTVTKKISFVLVAVLLALTGGVMLTFAVTADSTVKLSDDFSTVVLDNGAVKTAKFTSADKWQEHGDVGFYRTTTDTQSIVYELDTGGEFNGIAEVRTILNAEGGLSTYNSWHIGNTVRLGVFVSANKSSWFRVATTLGTAVPEGEAYAKKHANDLVVTTSESIDSSMKYVKLSLELSRPKPDGGGNDYSLGFKKVEISTHNELPVKVEAESVAVAADNASSMVAGGAGIGFSATIAPSNATTRIVEWKVFADEAASAESEIASFTDSTLTADHGEQSAQTVYVVGYVVGTAAEVKTAPFAVTVAPRPDPAGVTIKQYIPQMNKGDRAYITAVVAPANANDSAVTWGVFDDEPCTVASSKATVNGSWLEAAEKGTVYLQAKTANGLTQSKQIVITDYTALIKDDCSTTDFMHKTSDRAALMVHNGDRIMRSVPTVTVGGYAAGPAYVGANAEERFDVYAPPKLIYKGASDITRFEFDLLINFPTAEAAAAANNNPYRDYNWETFTSVDGADWTYIDNDYYVNPPAKATDSPTAYAQLKVFNDGLVPAGTRYVKLVLLGPCTTVVKDADGNVDRARSATNFYESTTQALSQTVEGGYDSIWGFFNTWEPAVNGVTLYAAEGTVPAYETAAIRVTKGEGIVAKGTDYSIVANTFTMPALTAVPVTDFTGFTVDFITGGEYLQYANGKISLKPGYNGQITSAKFKLVKGDVESAVVELALVLPVESVAVTLDKTAIKIGEYARFDVTVSPAEATADVYMYFARTADGGSASSIVTVLQDGRVRGKASGKVLVWAEADGVKSNEVEITVIPELTLTIDSAKTVKKGGSLTLSYTASPQYSGAHDAKWEIVSGGEFATLSGNKLTATGVGKVKVRVTVLGEYTAEAEIEVTKSGGCGGVFNGGGGTLSAIGVAVLLLAAGAVLFIKKMGKKSSR